LHPLPLNNGGSSVVEVTPIGPRHFRLAPWPFEAKQLTFSIPARPISGKTFTSSAELETAFSCAPVEMLVVSLTE
jgi:hypothetical protein